MHARTPLRAAPSDRLQLIVGVCSVLFTLGTTLQNFVIINPGTVTQMMLQAGRTPAQAAAEMPGFLAGFRLVGCLYIAGNALGVLALARRGRAWLFWVALAVNLTQAAGVLVIPPAVWETSLRQFGVVGILPSAVTDGGAAVVALLLVAFLVRHRGPWRPVDPG